MANQPLPQPRVHLKKAPMEPTSAQQDESQTGTATETGAAAPTPAGVGRILRSARVQAGHDMRNVAEQLRIRTSLLNALENEEYAHLPGGIYSIGFVRSYANFLGLDSDAMVRAFREEAAVQTRQNAYHFPRIASERRLPGLGSVLIGTGVLIALVYAGYHQARSTSDPLEELTIPPLPDSLASLLPEDARPQSVENAPFGETSPENPGTGAAPAPLDSAGLPRTNPLTPQAEETPAEALPLIITAEQATWVRIVDESGQSVASRLLEPGDDLPLAAARGLSLATGNAAALRLTLDGEALGPLSEQDGFAEGISLAAEDLRNRFSAENDGIGNPLR